MNFNVDCRDEYNNEDEIDSIERRFSRMEFHDYNKMVSLKEVIDVIFAANEGIIDEINERFNAIVKVKSVEGMISDYHVDLLVRFTNKDELEYEYKDFENGLNTKVEISINGKSIPVNYDDLIDGFLDDISSVYKKNLSSIN